MAKKDFLIIGLVLFAAAALFFATRAAIPAEAENVMVTIYVNDETYASVPADEYQQITIDQGDGKINVVSIDETGVRMLSSTCRNQICVRTGTIHPDMHEELLINNWIVCLPNGVSVEISGAEDNES